LKESSSYPSYKIVMPNLNFIPEFFVNLKGIRGK
jgi:hypothetical protein